MVGLQGLQREETKPPSHHSSPSLHGNESEALDTVSVDLTNAFQLVNSRQNHSLYLPVSTWMLHLWKEQQEAVQTMLNDFGLCFKQFYSRMNG